MANSKSDPKRDEIVRKLAACEARVVLHGAKADAYMLVGKTEKAEASAATMRRQQIHAANHRRALEDYDDSARRAQIVRDRAVKAQGARQTAMAQYQETARALAAQNRPDALQIYTEAMQHADELRRNAEDLGRRAASLAKKGDTEKAVLVSNRAVQQIRYSNQWVTKAEAEALAAAEVGRDLPAEHARARNSYERVLKAEAKESKRLKDIKVEQDLRTAAAQREFVARGDRGNRGASLAEYATLIRKPQDRTNRRLEAMWYFDNLCSSADAGLFPEMAMERESSSGTRPGGLAMLEKVSGLHEMDDLRSAIGGRNVDMLRARIHDRSSLTQLAREGYGTETTVAALVLAALDSMAVYVDTRIRVAARLAGQQALEKGGRAGSTSQG